MSATDEDIGDVDRNGVLSLLPIAYIYLIQYQFINIYIQFSKIQQNEPNFSLLRVPISFDIIHIIILILLYYVV